MGDVDPTGDRVWRDIERENDTSMTDDEAEEIIALVDNLPPAKQVDFVLGLLEKVQAERDHLRDQLAEAMAAGQSMEGQCHDLEDERDRLRAVVDAVRHFIALQVTDDHPPEDDAAAWDRMVASLEQLDVSPTIGGEE